MSAAKTSAAGINWSLRQTDWLAISSHESTHRTQPSNIVHCCLRPNHGRRLFGGLSHAGKNPGPTQGHLWTSESWGVGGFAIIT